jgi:DNA-binding beta-propeller fold protein YncE
LFLLLLATHAGAAPPLYRQTATVILGPPDHWDYLTFDPGTQRVFMARDTEITAVDGRTLRVAGRVPGPGGAHGVAVVPGGQGYAAFGGGTVLVFNPATLRITGQVAVQPGADALVQDAMRQALYVINGKNGDATLIDTRANSVRATIHAGGKLEFAAPGGQGALFVNQVNTGALLRLDLPANRLSATWPMPGCDRPHGLAYDSAAGHLFATCANNLAVILDAGTGRVLASPPIGHGSDAAAFDAARHRFFSSNGDGTLSVIDSTTLRPVATVPTAAGARTMALDPASGRIFLVTADPADPATKPAPDQPHRFIARPGTAKLLVFDPAG